METQIHQLEQEAYTAVLRAFKAQSDAISWVLSSSFALIVFCQSHDLISGIYFVVPFPQFRKKKA
jgi:hypothetical protein